ncbi:hypothetical protein HJA89_10155 [Rhizobium bangladeshense]|uniref:hypothetical protein n=1 Tax=Rhizobium TaxID=379 RepID=UPI001C829F95|nr:MULTISPECIES: hypothetical protein [Rhizobium]MBX4873263.1 hypothetical protein [Rhizobium bangladeshense]MBX4884640.1 hypothetical protein [Rhizobium bangladeshense]MBX5146353.1 hypothetical protein [Rhizobium lentis]
MPKTSNAAATLPGMTIIASDPAPHARRLPVPMLASEIIRIETAMHFAQVGDKTIRRWAHADGIGRQAEKHGPLQVSFPGLLMKLDGEAITLERFRSGDRDHPDVQFYLRRAIDLLEQERLRRRR